MRQTDVVIAGGGLAGSLAAAMLGRAGIDAVLIDPHSVYPPDFRCEKLDGPQLQTLRLDRLSPTRCCVRRHTIGILGGALRPRGREAAGRPARHSLRHAGQYRSLADFPVRTEFIHAKVTDICDRPRAADGQAVERQKISARLVVLATGLNIGLRHKLGIEREILSPEHSISIGFDVRAHRTGARFAFLALTYFTERPADRMAYITLFPIGATMRANLFAYRDLNDPWLKQFRDAPQERSVRCGRGCAD